MKNFIIKILNCFFILALILGMSACKSKESTKAEKNKMEGVSYADNSKTSLDWAGTYTGTVPCADCSGIFTQVTLRNDNTYSLQIQYLNKTDSMQKYDGTFQWNDSGSIVTLSGLNEKSMPSSYLVVENKLIQLDLQGKVITGDLALNYVLTKIDDNLVNKKWKLSELYGIIVSSQQPAIDAFITFNVDGNRVNGNSGCNLFTGTYKIEQGNRLHFSSMASTRKMCLDMSIENQMNNLFQNVDSYTLQKDTLNLNKNGIPLAQFVASE